MSFGTRKAAFFPRINAIRLFKSLPKAKKNGETPPRPPSRPKCPSPAQLFTHLHQPSEWRQRRREHRFIPGHAPRLATPPGARRPRPLRPLNRPVAPAQGRSAHARQPPSIVRGPCGAVLIRGGWGEGAAHALQPGGEGVAARQDGGAPPPREGAARGGA